jgi:hypothetical protein
MCVLQNVLMKLLVIRPIRIVTEIFLLSFIEILKYNKNLMVVNIFFVLARSYCLGYDTVKKNFQDRMFLPWMRTDRYRQKETNTQMFKMGILRSRRSTSAHRLIRCIQFIFTFHVCCLACLYGFSSII